MRSEAMCRSECNCWNLLWEFARQTSARHRLTRTGLRLSHQVGLHWSPCPQSSPKESESHMESRLISVAERGLLECRWRPCDRQLSPGSDPRRETHWLRNQA